MWLYPHLKKSESKYHLNARENNKAHIFVLVITFLRLALTRQLLTLEAHCGFDWRRHKLKTTFFCLVLAISKAHHAAGTWGLFHTQDTYSANSAKRSPGWAERGDS